MLWAVWDCWPKARHDLAQERVKQEKQELCCLCRLYLDFMGKNAWILLDDEVDVAQSHILDLTLSREQGDKGRCHLLVQCLHGGLVLNQIQLLQDDLNKHKQELLLAPGCHLKMCLLLGLLNSRLCYRTVLQLSFSRGIEIWKLRLYLETCSLEC